MQRDRHGFYQHYRQTLDSFYESILTPLKEKGDVDVYIATYPSDHINDLEEDLHPVKIWIGDSKKNTQVDTFFQGINLIVSQNIHYDKIICTRFDLYYLQPISNWNIWFKESCVYLPWREHKVWWEKFRNTGDFIHVIDGDQLPGFHRALAYYGFSRTDLHTFYDSLVKFCNIPRFLSDGHFTSDTMYSGKSQKNPIYRIAHRPNLITPNFDNTSTFIGLLGWLVDKIVTRITGKRIASWEISIRLKSGRAK